jgi:hypothetical protein
MPSSPPAPLTTFALFPTLPNELQQYIWHIPASSEAQQRGVRNQRIAPDFPSLKRGVDDLSTVQLQIEIEYQPHCLPKFLKVCANSQRIYTRWPKYNGGYVYVNKARDIFQFAGDEYEYFWFLYANSLRSFNITEQLDELALTQFKDQMKDVQHFAFDFPIWMGFFDSHNRQDPSFFTSTFPDMRVLTITIVTQSLSRRLRGASYRHVASTVAKHFRDAKRAEEFLESTFDVVKKSYPASRMPVLKVVTLDEAEGA